MNASRDASNRLPDRKGRKEGRYAPIRPKEADRQPSQDSAMVMLGYLEKLERACAKKPCLVLIDDIQWTHPKFLQVLEFLGRNLAGMPVMFAVTLRTGIGTSSGQKGLEHATRVEEELSKLVGRGMAKEIALEGLAADEGLALAASATDSPEVKGGEAPSWLKTIVNRSGGNPYFIIECVREAMRAGYGGAAALQNPGWVVLATNPRHQGRGKGSNELSRNPMAGLHLPASVSQLLREQVSHLTPAQWRVMGAAALIGPSFAMTPLVFALKKTGIDPRAEVLGLARLGLLEAAQGLRDHYRFPTPLLWEVVSELAPAAVQREAAGPLTDWWAVHRPEDVFMLARLSYRSDRRELVDLWVRRAIIAASENGRWEEVEMFVEMLGNVRGNLTSADNHDFIRILRSMNDNGESALVGRMAEHLLSRGLTKLQRWKVMVEQAVAIARSDIRTGEELIERVEGAIAERPRRADLQLNSRILAAKILLDANGNDGRMVLELVPRACALLEEARDWEGLAGCVGYWLWLLVTREQWDEAERVLARFAEVTRRPEVRSQRGFIEFIAFSVADAKGNSQAAEKALRRSVTEYGRSGKLASTASALNGLAIVLQRRGVSPETKELAKRGLGIASMFGLTELVALANTILGYQYLLEGRWMKALTHLGTAIATFEQGGFTHSANYHRTHLLHAEAKSMIEDPATVLEETEILRQTIPPAEMTKDSLSGLGFTMGWLHERCGHWEEASQEYSKTLEILRSYRPSDSLLTARALLGMARCEQNLGHIISAERQAAEVRAFCKRTSTRLPPIERNRAHLFAKCEETDASPRTRGRPDTVGADRKEPAGPTITEGILRHLYSLGSWEEGGLAPAGATQQGISAALSRSQNVFAKTLQRMVQKGLIHVESAYVRGSLRRKRVYRLTPQGNLLARQRFEGTFVRA